MRRSKEDVQATKEQIVQAAFDCFYENGFEATSLEEIAKRVNVTRGAIYWHFEDKRELYRAAVDLTLQHGDIATFAYSLPGDMGLEQRLEEVFWMALNENRYVDFFFKAMAYTNGQAEFKDVFDKLTEAKNKLKHFFDEEMRIFFRLNHIEGKNSADYSLILFLMFEGLFLTRNIPIGIPLGRETIDCCIRHALYGLPPITET